MYKMRDLLGKKVLSKYGKLLGVVDDLIININDRRVEGIKVKEKGVLNKKFYVMDDDILYIGLNVIIKDKRKGIYFTFKDMKLMEVYNLNGDIIGIVEDINFSFSDFTLNSIIISEGFLKNYSKGKRIILLKDIIVGDDNIIYIQKNPYYCYSKIHGVNENE